MNFRIRNIICFIGLVILGYSCSIGCFGAKEEYLGNNLYLSEYDNVDRRILYQEEKCAVSGTEIVPMTVLEYAYDKNWIIAKTGSRRDTIFRYWIINNSYDTVPKANVIKENIIGPLNLEDYNQTLIENKIGLILKEIK